MLIYASAENLSYTRRLKEIPVWLTATSQMFRARIDHSMRGGTNVHIQPIDNGSLLKAARHALTHIKHQGTFSTSSPEAFLNEVAVANPGKFSINTKQNKDYAGDGTPWLASKAFIQADLALLQPDIIIIPRTIRYALRGEPVNLDLAAPGRKIAPNYQITTGTINRLIKPKLKSTGLQKNPSPVDHWQIDPKWKRLDMSAYIQWLDEVAVQWVESSLHCLSLIHI